MDETNREGVAQAYARLPIGFETNRGQTNEEVGFLARGPGYTLFLNPNRATLALHKPAPEKTPGASMRRGVTSTAKSRQPAVASARVQMKLLGANSRAEASGLEELPGTSNYFIGKDPRNWRTGIPNYRKVRYREIYPGIDLIYYGNQGELEFDFVVAPGGDPGDITLAFEGAHKLELNEQGDLVLYTRGGEVRQRKPRVYQQIDGAPREIAGGYVLRGERVGFDVPGYDPQKPLVIDPVLSYSTYLGGSATELGFGIATDASGNMYVSGSTQSTDFPTQNPFQNDQGGPDAFVTKFNAAGSQLLYSTYLGGSNSDSALRVVTDSAGNAYLVGLTSSTDFPATAGAFQTSIGGTEDGFVAKLNPTGSALVYATYLGGSLQENAEDIALDSAGSAYVIGFTLSANFPTTLGALQTTFAGGRDDVFVTKLNPTGSAPLVYSTYLGGSGDEDGTSIAVDSAGNAYVAAQTSSPNLATPGSFQSSLSGPTDAFVAKLNASGSALVYFTYLGGSRSEDTGDVAVDGSGSAYVAGLTDSTNFPTRNPLQGANAGGPTDAFVTKLNPNGSDLAYSTYLGGSNGEFALAIAVDSVGSAYVGGETISPNFPVANAIQNTFGGGTCNPAMLFIPCGDAFLTKLTPAGALLDSTFLGGSADEIGRGIAVDGSSNAYLVGETRSSNFPTANPFQSSLRGLSDVFVARISTTAVAADFTLTASPTSASVPAGQSATYTITVSPQGGAFNASVAFSCSGLPGAASCSFSPSSVTPGASPANSTLTITTTRRAFAPPLLLQPPGTLFALAISLGAFALFAARRTNMRKLQPAGVPLLVLTLALAVGTFALGCGGGGSGGGGGAPPPASGTPAGNYTINITGTSGSVQRSTSVTLTVQ